MAQPTTRAEFKEWCLRKLGKPVIEINVDDDQVDDRIDEALQYFSTHHFDQVEKMYLKYEITADDITRARGNTTTSATDIVDTSVTASFKEGNNFIPMPSTILSVVQVFPMDNAASSNMFDIKYQMRLNDLYDFSSTSMVHYEMTMQHLDYISHILVGQTPLRFSEHQSRLYLDMDWEAVSAGEFLIIECYRKLDPTTYADIYNNIHLKRYASALIKNNGVPI